MKKEQILNQQEQDQELNVILSAFTSIYNGNSKQLSYSDTHNIVYKLCKKGQAEQIMKQLNNISLVHFQNMLSSIDKQNSNVDAYFQMFQQVQESVERLAEILLYVQSNYMANLKMQQTTIKDVLNSTFFQVLSSNKEILHKLAELIAVQKINQNQDKLTGLIAAINRLDEKQVFLPQYLFDVYNKQTSAHLKKLFTSKYQQLSFAEFLKFATEKLRKEREWLQKNFMRIKGKKTIQQLSKQLFDNSLTSLKQQSYQQKKQQLFEQSTLQFLTLLNQKNDIKQINDFNDWYIQELKKKLDKIDRSDNTKFLNQFIQEYQTISQRLTGIKEFNINYKVTFFFEFWINQDKIHFPRRLNVLLEKIILKENSHAGDFKIVSTLFKILKEKDYFQKELRRASAMRNIYHDKTESDCQALMVSQMASHCGADWVQKLTLMRNSFNQSSFKTSPNFKALVIEDSVWPFERVKSKCVFPAQLLKLSGDYKACYEQKFSGRSIQWHPIQGYSILSIKFNNHVQQFKVDTAMTILLLGLQSFKFKASLHEVLSATGLLYPQVKQQLQLLKSSKIILLDPITEQNLSKATIQLNFQHVSSSSSTPSPTNLTHHYLQQQFIQKQGHEQLKAQRKMMVESYIIKIMKSNKTITKKQLFEQITPMIEGRGFKFNQKFVENCFDVLIDKRYIKDLEDGSYSYLAS